LDSAAGNTVAVLVPKNRGVGGLKMAKLTWFLVILLFLVGCGSSTSKMSFDEWYSLQIKYWEKAYEDLSQEDRDVLKESIPELGIEGHERILNGLRGRYLVKGMYREMVETILLARGGERFLFCREMETNDGMLLYRVPLRYSLSEKMKHGGKTPYYSLWFMKIGPRAILRDWTVFYH